MKTKTLTAMILASVLSIVFVPKNASAAITIPVSTEELFAQLARAENEMSVRLENDITLTKNTFIYGKFDLDLNGKTLNVGSYTLVPYVDSDVTIRDNSDSQSGKIYSSSGFAIQNGASSAKTAKLTIESGTIESNGYGVSNYGTAIMNGGVIKSPSFTAYNSSDFTLNDGLIISTSNSVTFRANDNSHFTINGGTIEAAGKNGAALVLSHNVVGVMNGGIVRAIAAGGDGAGAYKNSEFTINGGEIIADGLALYGNGSGSEAGISEGTAAKFTINDGTITSNNGTAVYIPQRQGVTTVNGGTITGLNGGIEIRAGSLEINGGTITATTDMYEVTDYTNGTSTKGAAIAVVQHTTKQPIDVHISGGSFKGKVALSEANPLNNPPEAIAQVSIRIDDEKSVPVFISTDPNMTIYSEDLTAFIYGGRFTASVEQYIAEKYCQYIEKSTDKRRVRSTCEEEQEESKSVTPKNPETFDIHLVYYGVFAASCIGLCGATAAYNYRKK